MKSVLANIKFIYISNRGRKTAACCGYRPPVRMNNKLTETQGLNFVGKEKVSPGESNIKTKITFINHDGPIKVGDTFEIMEPPRVVGEGKVISID